MKALSWLGGFKDPETSGAYVGFMAGVIAANPDRAEELIAKMFPLPDADQWAIVRAIAYPAIRNGRRCYENSPTACHRAE